MSKRISVPDFEEMLTTKPTNININIESEVVGRASDEETNAVKSDKTRSADIYSKFSTTNPPQEKEGKPTPISDILTTMFKSNKFESTQPDREQKGGINSIVENLKYIENAKKAIGDEGIGAKFEVVEQVIEVKSSIVNEEQIPEVLENKPFEGYPKLLQPVNEEQAVKLVRGLKLWASEIELRVETIPEYGNYFYVSRKNSMTKIGNSYIVDKSTGKVYIVSAAMPEAISFKKIINNVIKPVS